MKLRVLSLLVLCCAGVAGCGDPVDRFLARGEQRDRVVAAIASHPEVGPAVVRRMLDSDSTRAMLLEQVMGHGATRQELLMRVARDRSLLDGSIQFAVQDTAMRSHVLSVFRGMQMVGEGR